MNDSLIEVESVERLPLVSIVTITYNLLETKRQDYIKQCIESVHNQNYPFIEHIIIDGASNDGTLELLKYYEDLKYIKVFSQPDKGIYDAMNKGIALAKGKYINFLNSDDYFHNNEAVKVSVEYLEENSADYSFADTMMLTDNGGKCIWKGDVSRLLLGSHYCHQSMFVKTSVLRLIGGFDDSYTIAADTDLMIRLYARGTAYVKVPLCIVTYRIGGLSSQNQLQSRMEHSTAFYKHIGKEIGLSRDDCFLLCWNPRLFDELSREQLLDLIIKVPREYGLEYLIQELIDRTYLNKSVSINKRYYLLGFIPFIKYEWNNNCKCVKLFNHLILFKIVKYANKVKYLLFGFLPILKMKGSSLNK